MRKALGTAFGVVLALALTALAYHRRGSGDLALDAPPCAGCNIVLISVDTLRADHLPCYGYSRKTGPNLCRLADTGTLFEHAYSQAPATVPALRAIMAGSIVSNDDGNDLTAYYGGRRFLAEALREAGYATVGFTDHVALGGEYPLRPSGSSRRAELTRGFDEFWNYGKGRSRATSHLVSSAIASWLEENKEKKFFLWAHYYDPHFNYNPPPDYEAMFGFTREACGRISNGIDIAEIRKIQASLTRTEIDCLVALYDAEIFATDKAIGEVVHKIDDLGLGSRTAIFFTADHGEEFKERTRIGHEKTLYNEVLHVPLVVRAPGQSAPKRVRDNVGTKDIGSLIQHVISKKPFRPDTTVVSRTAKFDRDGKARSNAFAILSGRRKYILAPKAGKEEFFDLETDPGEKTNLADSKEKSDLARQLDEWITRNLARVEAPSGEMLEAEKERRERLRGLGYVD